MKTDAAPTSTTSVQEAGAPGVDGAGAPASTFDGRVRPILFSAPMVRALLAGTKTQTRRIAKGAPSWATDAGFSAFTPRGSISFRGVAPGHGFGESFVRCPYGVPGDRLWVRETFFENADGVFYRATDPAWDAERENTRVTWKPSIFMRRRQSRLTLEVTDVRVERVQDISESDARAEGVERDHGALNATMSDVARGRYEKLWGDINGSDSWAANPFVWVVSFKVLA